MVRLSPESEARDALAVLAADRRELAFTIRTERPLRKPSSPPQARLMAALRAEAANQISDQLDEAARRAFRGRVALELHLALPSGRHAASLPPLVKDYLDVLRGPVVPDDAVIDHLLVLRTESADEQSIASVRCQPLSVFTAEYDRAFRVLDELEPDRQEASRDAPWGLRRFDEHDHAILAHDEQVLGILDELDADAEAQLEEDPDAIVDLDVPSSAPEFDDPEVRANARNHLEDATAHARGRWLADQGFDARDRPGSPPAWRYEVLGLDVADVVELPDEGPGCFVVPAPPVVETPPGQPKWGKIATRAFSARRAEAVGLRPVRFGGALALDIGVRGHAGGHADLDNLANTLLRAFVRAFRASAPNVQGYRVYRQSAASDDVRVRLLPYSRLEALAQAMQQARELVRADRSSRARGS